MCTVSLVSIDMRYEVQAQLSQETCHCHIMHEDTLTSEVPGLPRSWPTAGALCHSIKLPCGHTFHPTALALHFLFRDMRCPVCRAGHGGAMDIASVPACMRDAFRAKLQAMCPAQDASLPQALQYAIRRDDIECLLLMTVEIARVQRPDDFRVLARTRLHRASPGHVSGFNLYETQCSFRRLLDTYLGTAIHHSELSMRFSVTHPLFPHAMHSVPVVLASITPHACISVMAPGSTQDIARLRRAARPPASHSFDIEIDTGAVVEVCVVNMHETLLHYAHGGG